MPSTSNSFVFCLTERGISLSITSFITQGENDPPLNPLSIFSQINEEIPSKKLQRFIRFSFHSQKTKTLNIIYKENQKKRRIKAAKFPVLRILDTFDFDNLKHVVPETIWDLANNSYVERRENIICMGNPGMGKTHLSIALGLLACNEGFRVRFYSGPILASELVEAQESHSLIKLQKQLSRIDLLILDDLSYLSFSKRQSELLFQVISDRSELASLIISTNLEFSKWVDFFGDPMLTAALVDRVTHRAHILNMNGDSYRLKESKARNTTMAQN